jgi:hypothetical protein
MATRLGTAIDTTVGSNAAIRSWAGEISATFTAGGWVQTSDTGQTASSALTGSPGVNTSSGYQIWRMADSLQTGASTVFLKLEYGEGASTSSPSIWITLGTGSDGAGNITGAILARTQITAGSGTSSSSITTYGSATTSRVSWVYGNSSGHLLFSIERTKDASGNDTNEGLLVLGSAQANAILTVKINQYLRFTNNTLLSSTAMGTAVPSGATWADGSNFGVSPVRFFNGTPSNPCISWLAYLNGDTAQGVSLPVQIFGVTRTFMPLGNASIQTVASANSNSSFMMIYE